MADLPVDVSAEHVRFCEEYCKDRNGTRAALAAGLASERIRAANVASELLRKPYIRDLVRRVFREQARRLKTGVPDLVREWAVLGKSDLTDYVVAADGRLDVAPGVPRSALRAVKKVKQTRTERLSGETLTVETKTEIELHGKEGPLAKLYEHLHGVLPGEGTNDDAARVLSAVDAYLAARLARPGGGGGGAGDAQAGPPVDEPAGGAGGGVPESG
jgi:phage terminase small subunit